LNWEGTTSNHSKKKFQAFLLSPQLALDLFIGSVTFAKVWAHAYVVCSHRVPGDTKRECMRSALSLLWLSCAETAMICRV